MAGILSKGIKISVGEQVLTNLQGIPDLGGEAESVEVTVLSDAAHMFINGILNYGDNLPFKFLYEKAQFEKLAKIKETSAIEVELPDGEKCAFNGTLSVKLDAVGVNAPLTYTLNIKPNSEMTWSAGV